MANEKPSKEIIIYTDGACSGNPGPGGYGAVLLCNGQRKELSEGFKDTTNNRMEMMAVIRALQALKAECRVTVYSDSKYLVDSVEKGWAIKWRVNGWRRSNKERALNVDLWQTLLQLIDKHDVKFKWVKGHAENEENERCDFLAVQASKSGNLKDDVR
jgi:ribonuclease HI